MKKLFLLLCAAVSLSATTTTVSQTVTGPDGNPVNGTVLLRMSAACRSGSAYVGQQTLAVNFLSGALSVGLAPNDTCVPSGTSYTVSFLVCLPLSAATSAKPCPAGAAQSWSATWVIPTSSTPVTVDSVTVATAPISVSATNLVLGGDVSGVSSNTTVTAIRGHPVTSTAPADGQLMKWSASAGTWIYVAQVTQAALTGTVDGTNTAFTTSFTPLSGLMVTRNGLVQQAGLDFNITGNTVTFVTAATPQPGDVLAAWYQH